MRTIQDITFDVTGQKVYFDAPEGRPSSVTSVEVFAWDVGDDDTAETAVGAGSVETDPNTIIDSASGAGQSDPRVLNVAATTGFVIGRLYLATGADGYSEWFECAEIDSGNSVAAKHPLLNSYASPDAVASTRIQATIDSTWVADDTNLRDDAGPNGAYRVRWAYVVSSVSYVAETYFNLVRYAGKHGVRPQDVEAHLPGWLDSLPTDHRRDQGRRLIDEAYRAVKIDLQQVETDDAMVANTEIMDELTRYKTVELSTMTRALMTGERGGYDIAKAAYQSRFDSLARITVKVPVRDTTAAAGVAVSLGLSRR